MKRYQCHKIVEAGGIISLGFGLVVLSDGEQVSLSASDEDRITKMMTADSVHGLGYLVRYEDGYLSWSPTAVFESGYDLIDTPKMDVAPPPIPTEIERLRAENRELRRIVSALELGGTSERLGASG